MSEEKNSQIAASKNKHFNNTSFDKFSNSFSVVFENPRDLALVYKMKKRET